MYIPDTKTFFIQRAKVTASVLIFSVFCGFTAAINLFAGAIMFGAAITFWIVSLFVYIPFYYFCYSVKITEGYLIINRGLLLKRKIMLAVREIQYCETTSFLPKTKFGTASINIYTCGSKITTCPFDIKTAVKIIKELENYK
ncbi:MAG: PH domain-containing protein [Clostridiales bacterium]|nr:PH domain-containing protein [Clostridiales bacterium]